MTSARRLTGAGAAGLRKSFPCAIARIRGRSVRRRGCQVLLLAAATVFASCGGSPPPRETPIDAGAYRYAPAAEPGTLVAATEAGDITVLCPKGWMETADPANAPNILLWLVREDYTASISFTEIRMDPVLYKRIAKDGLRAVASISLSLKKGNARDSVAVIRETEVFRMNGRDFAAYEYSVDGGKTVLRIAVFDTGARFIECALLPATSPLSAAQNRSLFEAQQTVLASMTVK